MSPDILIIVLAVATLVPGLPFTLSLGCAIASYVIHMMSCDKCREDAKRLIISRHKHKKE